MKYLFTYVAVVVFCLGTYFFLTGADKKNNYHNSEYSYSSNHNAYVGGDAYNYIINGNYFTGYMVLGGSCYLFGILCAIGQILVNGLADINETLEKYGESIINNIRQEQAKLPSLKTLIAVSARQNGQADESKPAGMPSQVLPQIPDNYSQKNRNQINYQ